MKKLVVRLVIIGIVVNQICILNPEVKEKIHNAIQGVRDKLSDKERTKIIEVRIVDERES